MSHRASSIGFRIRWPSGLVQWLVILGLCTWTSAQGWAASRVALVIGNSEYLHEPRLENPANDADDMAAVLRELGFRVIEGRDVDRAALDSKLREFIESADGADIALLFYAGHGMQIDGRNFLIPVDAKLERRSALDFEVLDIDRVTAEMAAAAKTSLIFLDACRDNPLVAGLAAQSGRSIGAQRGLTPPTDTGAGTLIALSTSPGKVARDGEGRNSPFTAALLRHIRTPGLEIKTLMTRVRSEVATATRDEQIPWDTESLRTEVYLAPADSKAPPALVEDACTAEVDPDATAETIVERDVEIGLRACAEAVNQHPDDIGFVARLRAAKEQRAFKNAMKSSLREASDAYLLLYPSGRFAARVRARLAALSPAAEPTPSPLAAPDGDVRRRDTEKVVAHYWAVSNDRSEDGSGLASLYGDPVQFYGGASSRSQIMKLKLAYFKDWSVRRYNIEDDSVNCSGRICTEDGTVNWTVTSQARHVTSSGRSRFSFAVEWSGGQGKIISEGGVVISREAHKIP